jgi:AcrR family transcriptional regulator
VPTKAEQSEATRAALVRAAEELFAEHGFADTPTEALVQAAGVTRGALYHHFRDKGDLFRAVYEALEQRVIQQVEAAVHGLTDPLVVLRRGAEAFLDACLEPAVQRIVLLEGPTVLGWEAWHELDMAYGLGMITTVLEVAMQAGVIKKAPVEPLAHILLGGLNEAAMLMASSDDPEAARARTGKALRVVIDGLRADVPKRGTGGR